MFTAFGGSLRCLLPENGPWQSGDHVVDLSAVQTSMVLFGLFSLILETTLVGIIALFSFIGSSAGRI